MQLQITATNIRGEARKYTVTIDESTVHGFYASCPGLTGYCHGATPEAAAIKLLSQSMLEVVAK